LSQNIVPLDEERMAELHQERFDKILKLGLKGITNVEGIDEIIGTSSSSNGDNEDDLIDEDKSEMVNNVLEELKEHGDMDDS
jgi:hypothetical protein